MRKLKMLVALVLLCSGVYAQKKPYTVLGNVQDLVKEGKYIYSFYQKNEDVVIDSVKVQNGKYSFAGDLDQTVMMSISTRRYGSDVKIFVGPSEHIQLIHSKSFKDVTVSGSKANLEYNQVRAALAVYLKKMHEIDVKLDSARRLRDTAMLKRFQADGTDIYHRMIEDVYPNYIKNNPNSSIALSMLDEYFGGVVDAQKLEPLYNVLTKEVKGSAEGQRWGKILEKAQRAGVGKQAPDFTQYDQAGKVVRLSSFKGKYVLIDFWASWCFPCRAENKNVLRAYNSLKSKGFEVLGVSIDSDKNAWIKAIKDDGMPWVQVTDLKAKKNAAALLYGVDAIPQNWLIDPNGIVLGINLRGEDLARQIEKLINQSKGK
ncbi:AhpC/TSA family protein [Pedobacter sp. KBS0701]|uniref:TlpA disulfide reductase family protein n=1 Tax=Pedobacter sp. KBS0701 TaxID=2578106 RepID=UPI00110DAC04|nr:TlpA disulfide reductase family protein [Pedobacter sp. KBS0701]QDW24150.1 AhpC/TSA family protein [Pedobacter sp. KBS0701]